MLKRLFLLFALATSTYAINAQVKTNFNNPEKVDAKGKFKKNYAVAVLELAAPDLTNALKKEKAEAESGSKLFYIAEPMPVNIDAGKLASWVDDGRYSNGKFTLKSKGAKTLSINFSNFTLPKGTEMYIYNKDAEMITGVITDAENNETKVWGSSIYKGDEINIEIKVPVEEKEKLNLQITNVAYGYKNIFIEKVAGFGLSGACNINVLCPEGNNWVAERNSVVYIARSNGSALCSGAMLMNTCATNIPYVLTANHCFVGDGNVAGWRVHFQAWSATCTPNQNSDGILFNGSTLRANWDPSDFCLVQLNQTPPSNSGINYAGWSRATNASTSGVGIHHPSGDVMKISTYTTPLLREDNPERCNVNPVGELQWVVQWNQGVTEGGSSGSPLFDQNYRIVGQLSGGPSSCAQPANCRIDMYGRFDNSWTGGGTNATRLSNWLDPNNTGAATTNTTNVAILNSSNPNSYSISGPNEFCTSASYTISGAALCSGGNVTWSLGYLNNHPNVASLSCTNCTSTTLTKINNGTVWLIATVTFPNSTTYTYEKYIGVGTPVIRGWYNSPTNPSEPLAASSRFEFNWNDACYTTLISTNMDITANSTVVWEDAGNSGGVTWYQSGNNLIFYFSDLDQWAYFRVTATNSCGSQSWLYRFRSVGDNCSGGTPLSIMLSPNPTTSALNVTLVDKKDQTKQKEIIEIRLVDKMGTVKQKWNYGKGSGNQTRQLNVSNLPTDIYNVMVYDGTTWVAEKFIKQ